MKLKRTANKPLHGLGLMGHAREIKPVKAGEHLPLRTNTGHDDAKGYQGSEQRRMGKISTPLPTPPSHAGGNSKGSPPGGKAGASIAGHKATAGRGGTGTVKGEGLKASISHSAFEKLGAH